MYEYGKQKARSKEHLDNAHEYSEKAHIMIDCDEGLPDIQSRLLHNTDTVPGDTFLSAETVCQMRI